MTASYLLKKRIGYIIKLREASGEKCTLPTLEDLERTHVLFMHASFKPFVAFGMDYQKISPEGDLDYDSELRYNIGGGPAHFYADFGIRFKVARAVSDSAIRYASYPGERIIEDISLKIQGNVINSYDKYASASYRKHHICGSKMTGYKRLVGQETFKLAYSATQTHGNVHQRVVQILNGLQTPKPAHPESVFWHMGRLWHKKFFPNVGVPYGDFTITVKTARKDAMIAHESVLKKSRYVKIPTSSDILNNPSRGFTSASVISATTVVGSEEEIRPHNEIRGGDLVSADMYINNIITLPEVHRIYIARCGFLTIRKNLKLQRRFTPSTNRGHELLHGITKNVIERIYFGIRPARNADDPDAWWSYSKHTKHRSLVQGRTWFTLPQNVLSVGTSVIDEYSYEVESPIIEDLELTSYGMPLSFAKVSDLYSDYIPTVSGEAFHACGEDPGAYVYNFGLYPDGERPSGHFAANIVELYMNYGFVNGHQEETEFILNATAMDFLLIGDGKIIPRYSS